MVNRFDTDDVNVSSSSIKQLQDGEQSAEMSLSNRQVWYLGIDFGTTGISAVLLNYSKRSIYPLFWLEKNASVLGKGLGDKQFRLPPLAYLSAGETVSQQESETRIESEMATDSSLQTSSFLLHPADVAVKPVVLTIAAVPETEKTGGLLLENIKPYLKASIPYYSPETLHWEPVLQWSDAQQISLGWLRQALQGMLATIGSTIGQPEFSAREAAPTEPEMAGASGLWFNSQLAVRVSGLDRQDLSDLERLEGAIIGCPANWSDAYRFNLREAILGAKLVSEPSQCMFVEEAIASVLSELRDTAAGAGWQGVVVAIDAGASTTELVLVDVPGDRQKLTYSDFKIRSFAYAGNAIDQDIICQLLLNPEAPTEESLLGTDLELPRPGELDLEVRYRVQQRLQDLPWGRTLLDAAKTIKQVLQHQNSYTLILDDRAGKLLGKSQWEIRRRDLEMKVLLPFLRLLNREFNTLLARTGVATQGINQAICTGGTASIPAIARWLRQKLPSAAILQDTYPMDRPPVCSRVAYGLATLPLYPQILDFKRQQYSDYFLFLELLRVFPSEPLSLEEILQLLERRGINTRACKQQILRFLDGYVPPGLAIEQTDAILLTLESRNNGDYTAAREMPLFEKEGEGVYRPNVNHCQRLREFLDRVLADSYQTLEEPYLVEWQGEVKS